MKGKTIYQLCMAYSWVAALACVLHPDGYNYEECTPDRKTCEYWLVVQEHLTMIYEKNLVYAHKGNLYLYNEHHSNFTTHVCSHSYFISAEESY